MKIDMNNVWALLLAIARCEENTVSFLLLFLLQRAVNVMLFRSEEHTSELQSQR